MSIENFFATNPADPEFTQAVSWERFKNTSPVSFMANILINEGKDGLKPFADALNNGEEKPQEFFIPFFVNSSSIFLGVSLLSIEDMIREGQFDQETFNARINMAHSGTYITPEVFSNPICEEISIANYKGIIQTAIADKTLASFFRRDFIALPESLQEMLEGRKIIRPIKDFLLTRYEDRVRLLIPHSGQQVTV